MEQSYEGSIINLKFHKVGGPFHLPGVHFSLQGKEQISL